MKLANQIPRSLAPKRLRTSVLALALSAILAIGMPCFATQAFSLEMQEGIGSLEPNTPTATTIGFGDKEWVLIGYDGEGVVGAGAVPLTSPGDGTMILLLKQGSRYDFPVTKFSDDNDCTYEGSMLESNMRLIYSSRIEDPMEKTYIIPRSLHASTSLSGDEAQYLDTVYGTADIASVDVWPLSPYEADSLDGNLREYHEEWWLRSAGEVVHRAATVGADGTIDRDGLETDETSNVLRPALRLGLESVLYSSAADSSNGKEAAAVGNDLAGLAGTSSSVKFTMLDANQNLELVATKAESIQTAPVTGQLTFSYKGATTGLNQYISCVLKDNASGDLLYYGKIASSASAADGSIALPLSGIGDGSYTILVFSEQANDALSTDYASAPVSMTLSVSNGMATVGDFGGTIVEPEPTPPTKVLPATNDTVTLSLVLAVSLSALALVLLFTSSRQRAQKKL